MGGVEGWDDTIHSMSLGKCGGREVKGRAAIQAKSYEACTELVGVGMK